ncbi:MAG: M3 family metallopeptidase [Ichthyobacteriaceae bacterium]|nr:M3 family metallopeptidase [Ichthyobacteriaceae bacterium]
MNPLLEEFNNDFGSAPFDKIKNSDFLPAIKEAIKQGEKEIEEIVNNKSEADFKNTIVALDNAGSLLNRTSTLLGHLNSAETNDEIQTIQREASPLMTEFYNNILLNEKLFEKIKFVFDKKDELKLNIEQTTLLNETYKQYANNGALLNADDKNKLRELNKKLSELSISFGENLLAETNENFIEVKSIDELSGLSEEIIAQAKKTAEEKKLSNSWVLTLHAPSFVAVTTYANNRELREKMVKEYMAQGNNGNSHDNRENVKNIVKLRLEKANILGYKTYSDFVLTNQMANTSNQIYTFLNELLVKAKPVAIKEKTEVEAFMKNEGADFELQKWDWAYYSEKLKKEKFNINDDDLKPYFELNQVQNGMFEIAHKLFDLNFKEIKNIPTWHKDVKTFDVTDADGKHVALFYTDYFPRAGKRGGAWMNALRNQQIKNGVNIRPHIINICNFTPPSNTKPSLLTFREVETMFHEFGHGLHGMLANTKYSSLSGTSVYRDFVELPSQILENWVSEPEALKLFAKHYKTGEVIPTELIDKIKESSTFNEGYATVRQLSFGFLDMNWHTLNSENITELESIEEFEKTSMAKTDILPFFENNIMSSQFGHLFAGGYASGYYGYKWAEVLDADAFEAFKENGIFDKTTADKFKNNILTKGGTEHPMTLYKRFRGAEPSANALARRAGFIK